MRPTSGGGPIHQKIYMYKYAERGAICGRRSFVRHARRGHAAREQIDGSRRLYDARRNAPHDRWCAENMRAVSLSGERAAEKQAE
jgi:hypothetical protein